MSSRNLTAFGKLLHHFMIDNDMRSCTMAEDLSVSRGYMSAISRGLRPPTSNFVESFLRKYKVDRAYEDNFRMLAARQYRRITPLPDADYHRDLAELLCLSLDGMSEAHCSAVADAIRRGCDE